MNYFKKIINGRIGRKNLLLAWLFYFLILLAYPILIAITAMILPPKSLILNIFTTAAFIIFIAIWLVLTLYLAGLNARRLHDIGLNELWILCILIPFIGYLRPIILLIYRGDKNKNRYGEVPPKNIKFLDDILNRKINNV